MKKIPKEIYQEIGSVQKIIDYQDYVVLETNKKKYLYEENNLYEIEKTSRNKLDCLKDLYLKTTEEIYYSSNQINLIYQKMVYESDLLLSFFFRRQDQIEEELTPSKQDYDLLLNISKIYHMISIGRYFLEEWMKIQEGKYQNVFWINKFKKEPLLKYKINVSSNYKTKDNLVFALANYYQTFYDEKNIIMDLEEIFQDLSITTYEKDLVYSLISLPINKADNKELIHYTNKTVEYLSEKYKEDQETKETMLKKQQEDIKLRSDEQ
jgi:hypothetical protein